LRQATPDTKERRRKRVKAYSMLNLGAQLMEGERLAQREISLVEATLDEKLRRDDCFCQLDDGSFLIVLEACHVDDAATVAHRISLELMAKSATIQRRNWHARVATYPRKTEESLIKMARAATVRRHRVTRSP
jgi:GGDEF domain-containing protein